MKARDSQTGTFKEVYVKALDSMPVGTQIEYTGDTIPTGWEEVNDYSTTEIDTGKKWIDGKPIYRKVLEYSSETGTNFSKDISSLGISKLIKLNFSVEHGGSYEMQNFYMSSTDRLRIFYNGSNSTLQFRINLAESTYNITVILEYTKTTD